MLQAGYIPLPNVGGAENYIGGFGEPANYFAVAPDYYSYNQPMIRVDYNTSDKTKWYSFFGRQTGHEAPQQQRATGAAGQRQLFRARQLHGVAGHDAHVLAHAAG